LISVVIYTQMYVQKYRDNHRNCSVGVSERWDFQTVIYVASGI
jgi:hypothetical protein